MNCPNCGGPMRMAGPGSYLYCRYCSSFHFPEDSPDGVDILHIESDYRCPLCKDRLVAASVAGETALYCRRCHGLLIRQQAFAAVVQCLRARAQDPPVLPRPLNLEDLRRLLYCPSCSQLMDTHPYYGPGNVVIDVCMRCRLVWLDRGELDAIVDAPGKDRATHEHV